MMTTLHHPELSRRRVAKHRPERRIDPVLVWALLVALSGVLVSIVGVVVRDTTPLVVMPPLLVAAALFLQLRR